MTRTQLGRADVSLCRQCGDVIGPVIADICDACQHDNDAQYHIWVMEQQLLELQRLEDEAEKRRAS